jgi:hypothetical protein
MNEKQTTAIIVILAVMVGVMAYFQFVKAPAVATSIVPSEFDGDISAVWVSSADTVGRTTGSINTSGNVLNVTSMAAFDTGYGTMKIEINSPVQNLNIETKQTGDVDFIVKEIAVVESKPDITASLVQATSVEKDETDVNADITYNFLRDADVYVEMTFVNDNADALSSGALNTVTVSAGDADKDGDESVLSIIK